MSNSIYALILQENLGWCIGSTPETYFWLNKFATILKLKYSAANGFSKLIFTTLEVREKLPLELYLALDIVCSSDFPQDNWWGEDLRLLKLWRNQKSEHIICQLPSSSMQEANPAILPLLLHPIYQKIIEKYGLPMHAGLIEKDGKSVILAAPSHTGKSTCCRRIGSSWRVLCDDEVVLLPGKEEGYVAHPFPTWSECVHEGSKRTWNVKDEFTLSAIFFLSQSQADGFNPVNQAESAAFLHQLSLDIYGRGLKRLKPLQGKEQSRRIFDNACKLAKEVPAYILHVSREGKFWEKIEEAIADSKQ